MSKRERDKESDDQGGSSGRRMKMKLKTPLQEAVEKNDTNEVEALLRKEWDEILDT